MNMIERVARAMARAQLGYDDYTANFAWDRTPDLPKLGDPISKLEWMTFARAAIEAMREPTEEMLNGSTNAEISHTWSREGEGITMDSVADIWSEMISAALKEE